MTYKNIFDDLCAGRAYGNYITKNMRYPYFNKRLYITPGGFIGWNHYGSSAQKCNVSNLKWILNNIFKTDAEGFARLYLKTDATGRRDIVATLTDGRRVKYTDAIISDLIDAGDVLNIIDAATGEVIYNA